MWPCIYCVLQIVTCIDELFPSYGIKYSYIEENRKKFARKSAIEGQQEGTVGP